MSDMSRIADLIAAKDFSGAVPILQAEVEKDAENVKLRLQLADALSGAGRFEEALEQYAKTEAFYQAKGLIVQTMGVKKKIEKVQALLEKAASANPSTGPEFESPIKKNPLLEDLSEEERNAILGAMELEEREEGDVIISEGDDGISMFVIVSGAVKVYTRNPAGDNVYLAKLGENDFFGEVSLLTGKARTATIAAAAKTELLRLDKERFDEVVRDFPRVREILDKTCTTRATETVEAMIDNLKSKK